MASRVPDLVIGDKGTVIIERPESEVEWKVTEGQQEEYQGGRNQRRRRLWREVDI